MLVNRGLTLEHPVIGKSFHKSNHLTEIILEHFYTLIIRPEPVHIHVCMACNINTVAPHVGCASNNVCFNGCQDRLYFGDPASCNFPKSRLS